MLFSKWIEIPTDRAQTNPYSEVIKVCKGTVTRVWVLIPVPSAWCCGVQVWYSTSQVWPTSRTEWIPGGMVQMDFEESLKIDQPPLEFEVRCFNTDVKNKHKVWVGISILRPTISSRLREFLGWIGQGE